MGTLCVLRLSSSLWCNPTLLNTSGNRRQEWLRCASRCCVVSAGRVVQERNFCQGRWRPLNVRLFWSWVRMLIGRCTQYQHIHEGHWRDWNVLGKNNFLISVNPVFYYMTNMPDYNKSIFDFTNNIHGLFFRPAETRTLQKLPETSCCMLCGI